MSDPKIEAVAPHVADLAQLSEHPPVSTGSPKLTLRDIFEGTRVLQADYVLTDGIDKENDEARQNFRFKPSSLMAQGYSIETIQAALKHYGIESERTGYLYDEYPTLRIQGPDVLEKLEASHAKIDARPHDKLMGRCV